MQTELLRLLSARDGHFKLESGHHGDLWLDLDSLFLRPSLLQTFTSALAARLSAYNVQAICGPLVGGSLLAYAIAAELQIDFYYTERIVSAQPGTLYSVEYRLPSSLVNSIAGKSVAVVDDVINAGSAVRATCASVQAARGVPVVIGSLLVLGNAAPDYFAARQIPIETIAHRESHLWTPDVCPLCRAGVPLEDFTPDALT